LQAGGLVREAAGMVRPFGQQHGALAIVVKAKLFRL